MKTTSTYTIESVHGLKQTIVLGQFNDAKKSADESASSKEEK